jgi:flagellar motor protein MotB
MSDLRDVNQPAGALPNAAGVAVMPVDAPVNELVNDPPNQPVKEAIKEPVLKSLKSGTGIKTHQTTKRKEYRKKIKKQAQHGTWKLVYADFVTVLMAFFIVVWVMLFDNIAKRERIDTSCIEPLAEELKKQISGDAGLQSGKMPFEVDYSSDGLRITLLDAGEPLFQRGGTVLSEFAKKQFLKIVLLM